MKVARQKAAEYTSAETHTDSGYCLEHAATCICKGDVLLHKVDERDGKAIWCRRKVEA